MTCSLCHETVPDLHCTNAGLCVNCANAMDYYDSLSPEEWRAEEEAIARYMTEVETP